MPLQSRGSWDTRTRSLSTRFEPISAGAGHYRGARARAHSVESRSLVFTGGKTRNARPSPAWLCAAGTFPRHPGWHHGRIRAMRTRGQESLLTKLCCALERRDPATRCRIRQFRRFLTGLRRAFRCFAAAGKSGAAVSPYRRSAPLLRLSGRIRLLDALIDPEFLAHTLPEN